MMNFRSKEEEAFYNWCVEAKDMGIITKFEYEPEQIEIIPKVKYQAKDKKKVSKVVQKHLLNNLSYTPDFYIWCGKTINNIGYFDTDKIIDGLILPLRDFDGQYYFVIDVKGSGARYNDDVKFSILQKIIYNRTNIYVNKVVPSSFFKKTFIPKPTKKKDDAIWTNAPNQRLRSQYK